MGTQYKKVAQEMQGRVWMANENCLMPFIPSKNHPNKLTVTADFTDADWNTATVHRIFSVTGLVRVLLLARCTEDVDSAAHGATIELGTTANSAQFIAATDENTIDNGKLWYAAAGVTKQGAYGNVVLDQVINGGEEANNIVHRIRNEALTTGELEYHLWWEPLEEDASVVVADGTDAN